MLINKTSGIGDVKNNFDRVVHLEDEQIEKSKNTSNYYQNNDEESMLKSITSVSSYLIDTGIPVSLLTAFHLTNIKKSISNINIESRKINSKFNYPYCILNCLSISSSVGGLTSLCFRVTNTRNDLLAYLASIKKILYVFRMPLIIYIANKQINNLNSASNYTCAREDFIEMIMSSPSASMAYLKTFKNLIQIKESKYSMKFQLLSLIAMICGCPTLSFVTTIWPSLNKTKQDFSLDTSQQYIFIFKSLLNLNEIQMKSALLSLGEINTSDKDVKFHANQREIKFLTKVISSCFEDNKYIEIALSCINCIYNNQKFSMPHEINNVNFINFLSLMINDIDIINNKKNAMYHKLIYPIIEGFSLITILKEDMRARQNNLL